MLDILLVDDSERKIARISEILSKYDIASTSIAICRNLNSARQFLIAKKFDLVILDIQIPNHDGELPIRKGGIDLLKELHSRSKYNKPLCIVGTTEFADIYDDVSPLFADRLWNVIHYDETSSEWQERLSCKLEYLIELKKARNHDEKHDFDLGIITALITPEFEQIMALSDWEKISVKNDDTIYYKTTFSTGEKTLSVVAATTPQMGMPAAAVTATKFISHFHPKFLSIVGITAGVRGKVSLGDIVIADPCWDWGSGKRIEKGGNNRFEPDPLPERLHSRIKALFRDASLDHQLLNDIASQWKENRPTTSPALHIGPSASGACVVADGKTVELIKLHNRKLIGLEMESYAVMHAAANAIGPRPLAFSIKSVCDFADGSKVDDFQKYASFIAATFLKKIALKYL